MPKFKGQSISVVLLGKHNPPILNHDFLLKHGVLPVEQEPFAGLLKVEKGQGFTEFIATPVLTALKYGPVSIMVEEGRFQIADERFALLAQTPVVEITRRYFGRILRYTPLQRGGLNLNGEITFADVADEQRLDQLLQVPLASLQKLAGSQSVRAGLVFNFPWKNGHVEVRLPKSREFATSSPVGINYEFAITDIDVSLTELNKLGSLFDFLGHCLKAWNIEPEQ